MQPVKLSLHQAVELAELAVAERGNNYVYQKTDVGNGEDHCAYFTLDGSPSCLVGQILFYAGTQPFHHQVMNQSGIYELTEDGDDVIEIDHLTIEYLNALQVNQDLGTPWGETLQIAKVYMQETHGVTINAGVEPLQERNTNEDLVAASA